MTEDHHPPSVVTLSDLDCSSFILSSRFVCIPEWTRQNYKMKLSEMSYFLIFVFSWMFDFFFKLLFSGVYMIRIWSLTHTKKFQFPEEEGKMAGHFDKMLHQKTPNICKSFLFGVFMCVSWEFLMTFKFLLNDWTLCLCLVELLLQG